MDELIKFLIEYLGPLLQALPAVILFGTVVKVAVDFFAQPLQGRFPEWPWDLLWYVAFFFGVIVGWFAELNVFSTYVDNQLLGRILSSVLVGGGAPMVHTVINESLKSIKQIQLRFENKNNGTG